MCCLCDKWSFARSAKDSELHRDKSYFTSEIISNDWCEQLRAIPNNINLAHVIFWRVFGLLGALYVRQYRRGGGSGGGSSGGCET